MVNGFIAEGQHDHSQARSACTLPGTSCLATFVQSSATKYLECEAAI
jgi:hypothetical protein